MSSDCQVRTRQNYIDVVYPNAAAEPEFRFVLMHAVMIKISESVRACKHHGSATAGVNVERRTSLSTLVEAKKVKLLSKYYVEPKLNTNALKIGKPYIADFA